MKLKYAGKHIKFKYVIFSNFKYASILMYAYSEEMCISSNGLI